MSARRACDVFVECLEAEGVGYVFGIPGRHLRHALDRDVPSLIVLPIDPSVDVAISEELGETTASAPG